MDFYAISVTRDVWSRWIECRLCGTFVACDAVGFPIAKVKKAPIISYPVAKDGSDG